MSWDHPDDKVRGFALTHTTPPSVPDVETDDGPEPIGRILDRRGHTMRVVMPEGWRPRRPVGFGRWR